MTGLLQEMNVKDHLLPLPNQSLMDLGYLLRCGSEIFDQKERKKGEAVGPHC